MFALALAVVLSQNDVYTWTDADGVVHYTDGASGVPKDAEKTALSGAVTVLSREPQNLAKPLPERPQPAPSAVVVAATSASASAPQAPVAAPPGSFTHTTSYPGLEGLDVYYRHDPWPLYAPYGFVPPHGCTPNTEREPGAPVKPPAPPAPKPKHPGAQARPALRR